MTYSILKVLTPLFLNHSFFGSSVFYVIKNLMKLHYTKNEEACLKTMPLNTPSRGVLFH